MRILIDNREQATFTFTGYDVVPETATFPVGDYSLLERCKLSPASRPPTKNL